MEIETYKYGERHDGTPYGGTTYTLEIAKTGRAKCKGRCKQQIEKDSVKFVSTSTRDEYPMSYGRKIGCTTSTVIRNALERHGTIDALFAPGFPEALKGPTSAALQRILDGEAPTEEDLALDGAQEGLPPKPKTPRKRKPEPTVEELSAAAAAGSFDADAAKKVVKKLKVGPIKEALAAEGADDTGKKADLVERLVGVWAEAAAKATAPALGDRASSIASSNINDVFDAAEPAPTAKSEPAAELAAESAEPKVEPKAEPVEPAVAPTAEPTAEPLVAPKAEPAAEPKTGAAAEPVAEPLVEPKAEAPAEPTEQPKTEPTTEAAAHADEADKGALMEMLAQEAAKAEPTPEGA